MASSSTFLAREVYGRSGPAAAAAFPFFTVSSIFCWISSRSTFRLVSTAAATPSPSRIRPNKMCSVPTYSWCRRAASSRAICRTLRTRSVKLYPFISPSPYPWASRGLGLEHPTHIRGTRGRQLGIATLASLECGEVRGLGEDQQLVERIYTQARDQIHPHAQAHATQQVHRLLERQLACVLQQPVAPPRLVGHLVGGRAQQHVARLLLVLDHLQHDLPDDLAAFPVESPKGEPHLCEPLQHLADFLGQDEARQVDKYAGAKPRPGIGRARGKIAKLGVKREGQQAS